MNNLYNSLINVFTMFIHILILWYVSKTRIENEYLEQLITVGFFTFISK